MDSGFSIEVVPIVTYNLLINNKFREGEKLGEYYLSFFTELEEGVRPIDFLGQLKEHLAELLDNLGEEEWSQENIRKIVEELMCENPLSHLSIVLNELEYKRILFYV